MSIGKDSDNPDPAGTMPARCTNICGKINSIMTKNLIGTGELYVHIYFTYTCRPQIWRC